MGSKLPQLPASDYSLCLGGLLNICLGIIEELLRLLVGKEDNDLSVVVRADRVGGNALDGLNLGVDDSSLVCAHGLQHNASSVTKSLCRHSACESTEGLLSLCSVTLDVESHTALITLASDILSCGCKVCKILECVESVAVVADKCGCIIANDVDASGVPRMGELTPDNVGVAMGTPTVSTYASAQNIVPRPPALCQGCGHRDVYDALNKVAAEYPDARIFGDIGCYTLGALPPFRAIDSCVDMGASITMAKGAADAGIFPAIAVIGDSTFTHSGMTGLLDAINDNSNITVVISDNLTTAMTGGQDSAGTNKFEAICLGLGVAPEHVRVVVPLPKNMEEITRIIREEIAYEGVSVIIPRRECMQTLKRKLRDKK